MREKKGIVVLRFIASIMICITVITPILLVIITSVKTRNESLTMSFSMPHKLVFENYIEVISQGKLVSSFFNSVLYSFGSILIATIATMMASFVLARNKSGVYKVIYYFLISGIVLPLNMVSLMSVVKSVHLVNTKVGIIILYSGLLIPLSVFIAHGFFSTIPSDIDEAAVIDGCGPYQLFLMIILPLMKPVIATLVVLNFMTVWNQFLMPVYFLNSSANWPMTLAVYQFFGLYDQAWNLVSADIILTALPILILYVLGQKYIIAGITAGAVKG